MGENCKGKCIRQHDSNPVHPKPNYAARLSQQTAAAVVQMQQAAQQQQQQQQQQFLQKQQQQLKKQQEQQQKQQQEMQAIAASVRQSLVNDPTFNPGRSLTSYSQVASGAGGGTFVPVVVPPSAVAITGHSSSPPLSGPSMQLKSTATPVMHSPSIDQQALFHSFLQFMSWQAGLQGAAP